MARIILQIDDRGRITIPQSLRQAWRLRPGDYLVIDPDRKRIDRAEILTDEELSDPEVVKALHKLKAKAEKDLYAGRTQTARLVRGREEAGMNYEVHLTLRGREGPRSPGLGRRTVQGDSGAQEPRDEPARRAGLGRRPGRILLIASDPGERAGARHLYHISRSPDHPDYRLGHARIYLP